MEKNFANESEYQNLLEDIFFTKPEETVYAISISIDLMTAITNPKEIPVKPPFAEAVLLDFYYFGYCTTIHLEAMKSIMIKRGEIQKDEIDSRFWFYVWIKVYFNC